jgi:hypothetical protein
MGEGPNSTWEEATMKTLTILLSVLVLLTFVVPSGFASGPAERTVSGKVAAVNPEAIVVDVGSGKSMLDVGAIVHPDTKLIVKGKAVPVAGLAEEVNVGDTVRLKYVVADDLYAKEIVKK